ncbi:MAG: hypothetical protein LBF41_06245, partial [Deltaproteobacteria bacterium]|nr:hypothetical protein [Deltaproteobacteria bacterium]
MAHHDSVKGFAGPLRVIPAILFCAVLISCGGGTPEKIGDSRETEIVSSPAGLGDALRKLEAENKGAAANPGNPANPGNEETVKNAGNARESDILRKRDEAGANAIAARAGKTRRTPFPGTETSSRTSSLSGLTGPFETSGTHGTSDAAKGKIKIREENIPDSVPAAKPGTAPKPGEEKPGEEGIRKEEPRKEEIRKEEPRKEEIRKEEPRKEEIRKEEPRKEKLERDKREKERFEKAKRQKEEKEGFAGSSPAGDGSPESPDSSPPVGVSATRFEITALDALTKGVPGTLRIRFESNGRPLPKGTPIRFEEDKTLWPNLRTIQRSLPAGGILVLKGVETGKVPGLLPMTGYLGETKFAIVAKVLPGESRGLSLENMTKRP